MSGARSIAPPETFNDSSGAMLGAPVHSDFYRGFRGNFSRPKLAKIFVHGQKNTRETPRPIFLKNNPIRMTHVKSMQL
jgi:hypothetical protein